MGGISKGNHIGTAKITLLDSLRYTSKAPILLWVLFLGWWLLYSGQISWELIKNRRFSWQKTHRNTSLKIKQPPPLLLLWHCGGPCSRYMASFLIMNRVVAGVGAGFALHRALSLGRVVETSFNLQNNQKTPVWLQGWEPGCCNEL